MLRILTGLCACFLVTPVFAETAQDCIDLYTDLKDQYMAVSSDFEPICTQIANSFGLDAESAPGEIPTHCDRHVPGSGGADHWHLEAKGVAGQESSCSMMLRGLNDQEGCGTEGIVIELPNNEAAHWRNFLRDECRN